MDSKNNKLIKKERHKEVLIAFILLIAMLFSVFVLFSVNLTPESFACGNLGGEMPSDDQRCFFNDYKQSNSLWIRHIQESEHGFTIDRPIIGLPLQGFPKEEFFYFKDGEQEFKVSKFTGFVGTRQNGEWLQNGYACNPPEFKSCTDGGNINLNLGFDYASSHCTDFCENKVNNGWLNG